MAVPCFAGNLGSGAIVDLTTNELEPGSDYDIALRHQSIRGVTLTTNVGVYGFALTSDSGLTFTRAVVGGPVAAENALGQTEVIWKTLSERGTAGFHVERWDDASQTYVRVNDRLLPSAPDALGGSEYRLVDPTAMPGADYRYRLIEIETDGKTNRYGPYDVVVRPPG